MAAGDVGHLQPCGNQHHEERPVEQLLRGGQLTGCAQQKRIQNAAGDHQRQRSPQQGWHDLLRLFLVDEIRYIARQIRLKAGSEQHAQKKRVDHRNHEQFALMLPRAKRLGHLLKAQKQRNGQDHCAGTDDTGVCIGAQLAHHAAAHKQLFELKPDTGHRHPSLPARTGFRSAPPCPAGGTSGLRAAVRFRHIVCAGLHLRTA